MATVVNPSMAQQSGSFVRNNSVSSQGQFEKVTIGNATLYRGNCFDVLPTLRGIGAAVTDPPFGIGYQYRNYDDSPAEYVGMMSRLVPELIRVTNNGPCFVWQANSKADQWHKFFPAGFRIVAACKTYRDLPGKRRCMSWDAVIFWSGRSRIHHEVPQDWLMTDLRP